MRRRLWCLILLALGVSQSSSLADTFTEGQALYNQQSYEEALLLFKPLVSTAGNIEQRLARQRYLGLTYYHLQDYAAAKPLLGMVAEQKPTDTEVQFALASTSLALGELAVAQRAIQQVLSQSPSAEAHQVAGQIYLAQNQPDQALAELEMALQTEDVTLRQQVMMDILTLYLDKGLYEEADRAIQEATKVNPDSFEAEILQGLRAQLLTASKPHALKLGYRLESDSNVTLAPNEGAIFNVSSQSDMRQVLTMDATVGHALDPQVQLYAEAHLAQQWYHDLDDYNELRQQYILGAGYSGKGWGLRLPYEFTWNRLAGNPFLVAHAITPGVYYQVTPQHLLYVFGRYQENDFDEPMTSPAEVRSGNRTSAGALWLWQFHAKGNMRLVMERGHDETDGRHWRRDETRLYGTLEYQLTPSLKLGFGYQRDDHQYDQVHSLFLTTREDQGDLFFGQMLYTVDKHWQVQAQASQVRWDSNIEAYNYDRHLLSLGVIWQY